MLYVILIILLIVFAALLIELYCFSTIKINFKDNILVIRVKTPLYKRVITQDFNDKGDEVPKKKEKKKQDGEEEKPFASQKIEEIKKRVISPEKGIDIDELKNVWDEFCDMYSYGFGVIKKLLGKLRHKIYIKKTYIKAEYGTENPAMTGMIYGSVWNLLGIIYPFLTMYFRIDYPMLDITPDFYNKRFDIEAESIIKVRAAHIIRAGLSSLLVPAITYFKDKSKKGREKNDR